MPASVEVAAPPESELLLAVCLNCRSPLRGPYCAQCGQQVRDPDPTLRELVGEAWDAFTSVDGRVPASLRLLLLRPGQLTAEYLSGQRARYLPPLRLYLLCSIAFFLASAVDPPDRDSAEGDRRRTGMEVVSAELEARDAVDRARRAARRDSVRRAALARAGLPAAADTLDAAAVATADSIRIGWEVERELGWAPPWLKGRLAGGVVRVTRDGKGFGQRFRTQMPRLMFGLVPLFAALLALAYHSRRRRYPTHFVVALHLHAVFFAVFALMTLSEWLPWSVPRQMATLGGVAWLAAYVPLALQRVYGGRLPRAVLRAMALGAAYGFVALAAFSVLTFVLLLVY